MRSTYFRHFFASAMLAVMSFLILGMAFTLLSRNFLVGERRESMEVNAGEISRAAAAFADDDEMAGWELRMMITSNARSTGNSVLIVDTEGVIVSCSDSALFCHHIGKTLDKQTMEQLSSGQLNDVLTNLGGLYPVMYYMISAPVVDYPGGHTVGYTLVGYDSSRIMETWEAFSAPRTAQFSPNRRTVPPPEMVPTRRGPYMRRMGSSTLRSTVARVTPSRTVSPSCPARSRMRRGMVHFRSR